MNIFGGNTGMTYEDVQRKRKIANSLVSQNGGAPKNVGEGLHAIGRALAARSLEKRASERDEQLRGEFEGRFSKAAPNVGGLVDMANSPYAGRGHKKVIDALMKGAPNFARGGVMQKSGDAVVGEDGPEVVKLPKGARVTPIEPEIDMDLIRDTERGMFHQEDSSLGAHEDGVQVADASGNLPYGSEKLTGDQSKSVAYHRRALGANNTLDDPKMAEALTQYTDTFAGNFGAIGRKFQDAEYQVAHRAANEFLAAVLRKDTGAAITNQEFEIYGPMYLPQPGDKPELLKAKRIARKEALTAIEMGLGTAAPLAQMSKDELSSEGTDTSKLSDDELLKLLTGG